MKKKAIYYLHDGGFWGRARQVSQVGPQWLEIAKKGDWLGFLLCLEGELRRGFMCKEDHMV